MAKGTDTVWKVILEVADSMMATVTYGHPWDPTNLQGPLINPTQRDRASATSLRAPKGGRLVRGSGIPSQFDKGYLSSPRCSPKSTPKRASRSRRSSAPCWR